MLGVSALKLGEPSAFLRDIDIMINNVLLETGSEPNITGTIDAMKGRSLDNEGLRARWELECAFHAGGYARYPANLARFVTDFEAETGVPIDPVYGAKMFLALAHRIQHEYPRGTRVLVIHTGGLQGKRGYLSSTSNR